MFNDVFGYPYAELPVRRRKLSASEIHNAGIGYREPQRIAPRTGRLNAQKRDAMLKTFKRDP